jgi:perosamine synthetase
MQDYFRDRLSDISVGSNASIRDAMEAIDRGGLGLAILVDPISGLFQGLVTDGDVRRAILKGAPLQSPAKLIPRPPARSARQDISPADLMPLFSEQVRALPILDAKGRVCDLAVLDKRTRLPVSEPSLGMRELELLTDCVLSGWISSAGKYVDRFEKMFADFCDARFAISTCNGTTALHLALLAAGIGAGDEVIVPSLTFIATANAVTYTGARPIFVDVDPFTWNIDPELAEAAVTPRTKAIIPVHLYGQPADMDPINELGRRRHLIVIEDAAEAHGAEYHGRRVGSLGDVGVFSFYGNKIITTGEGGMVVTDREDIASRVRVLRDHGMDPHRRYWHTLLGFNYRMTNLQAAVGVAQMEKIDAIIAQKLDMASAYRGILSGAQGVTLPVEVEGIRNVYWLFTLLLSPSIFGNRESIVARLNQKGIETRPVFPPVHIQPIYSTGQHLAIAESISQTGISLPSSVGITRGDVSLISSSLLELAQQAA